MQIALKLLKCQLEWDNLFIWSVQLHCCIHTFVDGLDRIVWLRFCVRAHRSQCEVSELQGRFNIKALQVS